MRKREKEEPVEVYLISFTNGDIRAVRGTYKQAEREAKKHARKEKAEYTIV